jgi:hypothetical protein
MKFVSDCLTGKDNLSYAFAHAPLGFMTIPGRQVLHRFQSGETERPCSLPYVADFIRLFRDAFRLLFDARNPTERRTLEEYPIW